MALIYRRNNVRLMALIVMVVLITIVWRKEFFSGIRSPFTFLNPRRSLEEDEIRPPDDSMVPVLVPPAPDKNINGSFRGYSLEEMINQARILNFMQIVKNKEKFGDHRADDPVIVVQVHERENHLKQLLHSLHNVKGIEGATLIISRDKFTPEIDEIVDNTIDFCRYIEIFFPFSMQLFPDKFPGEDPKDCPRDLTKSVALERGCNNAGYPDMYGHYREVKFVQIKHHWLWKLNMVFAGIREIEGNTGPVLMLEDDNYVSADLIDVMRKAVLLRDTECKDCLVITLGSYEAKTNYKQNTGDTNVDPWVSSKHNIGMVLNQQFYEKLSSCSKYFCSYDDYNWDWTLQSTGVRCIPEGLHTLVLKVPRVYHLGCVGFHNNQGKRCDVDAEARQLESTLKSESDNLFPPSLRLISANKVGNSAHTQNGGWGDIRDHELCQSYTNLCKTFLTI